MNHANAQTLTTDLLWKTGRVSLDATSIDGQWAIYGVQRFDVSTNKGSRTLYLLNIKSGLSRPFTDESKQSSDGAFHPDGKKIGYLQGGKLYEIGINSDAQPILVSDLEMGGFQYAPNGKHLLFTQDIKLENNAKELYPDLPMNTAKVSDGLFYRHWKNWHDQAYSHVLYADYNEGKLSTPTDLMRDERFDCPLTPMGGMEQITWSPDSRSIAYTSRKLQGTAEAQSTNADIYWYNLETKTTKNLTDGMMGYDQDPVFSPDGKTLAWTSMERAGYEADRTRLMVIDLTTMTRRELSEGWVYEMNHPQWSADGKSLFFLSSERFTYHYYQILVADKKIRKISEGEHDFTALKVAGNELIGTRVAMNAPPELYATDFRSGVSRRLTSVTSEIWGGLKKPTIERRTVKTFDGQDMNVWLVLPPGFDPTKKYPALVYCQGGPQSALSQGFSYRWNPCLMASQGYVVVAPCRRGMPGSGQAWNDAIHGHWGDAMKDLLSATDAAAKEPFIDANKMGAVGASFGGYAVYWLAGNHQKRFKTFISHCGLFNLESFYGTTEEVWFPNYDFEGAYWQEPKPRMYREDSPHLFAKNWDTPILVIHNELDFRVPFGEGLQAFQAAQLQGVPSRLLTFPDEGHWMSKPQNSVVWQREFLGWLELYLK